MREVGPGQEGSWDLGRYGKGALGACPGGWQAWRLVETSAVRRKKEELAGQEGGILKCSPEGFGFGKTDTGKQRMGSEKGASGDTSLEQKPK